MKKIVITSIITVIVTLTVVSGGAYIYYKYSIIIVDDKQFGVHLEYNKFVFSSQIENPIEKVFLRYQLHMAMTYYMNKGNTDKYFKIINAIESKSANDMERCYWGYLKEIN